MNDNTVITFKKNSYKHSALRILLLLVLICVTLISCDTTHHLKSGRFSKDYTYRVNSFYSCCGCEGKYFNIYYHKKKIEQVVYSYNCYQIGNPTKYIFNYKKERLISCDRYVATTDSNYALQKLTIYEKVLFNMVDTNTIMKSDFSPIRLLQIKGFRKAFGQEATDPFPKVKKGYKLPIVE